MDFGFQKEKKDVTHDTALSSAAQNDALFFTSGIKNEKRERKKKKKKKTTTSDRDSTCDPYI